MRYETAQDAHLRLHNTVIRYKNRPCYVNQIPGQMNFEALFIDDMTKEERRVIDPNDPDVDITTPPLGFVSWGARNPSFGYVSRCTTRGTKQGLDSRNTQTEVFDFNDRKYLAATFSGWPEITRDISLALKILGETIVGNFKPFEQSKKEFDNPKSAGVALNRKVALTRVKGVDTVAYMSNLVGLYNSKKNTLKLQSRFNTPTVRGQLEKFFTIEDVS